MSPGPGGVSSTLAYLTNVFSLGCENLRKLAGALAIKFKAIIAGLSAKWLINYDSATYYIIKFCLIFCRIHCAATVHFAIEFSFKYVHYQSIFSLKMKEKSSEIRF